MYSKWGIPKDSLKPHDITRSSWYLFTWPHFSQPISIQYLIRPCPPTECINHSTHLVPFILTLTIRWTTRATPNRSFHQCQPVHPPAASACTREVQALASTACSINNTALGISTSICKISSFISQAGCLAHSVLLFPRVNTSFHFRWQPSTLSASF